MSHDHLQQNYEVDLQVCCLIRQLWNVVDAEQWDRMLALLTDDVDYALGGACKGKAEVAQKLKERPALHVSRHLVTNELVRRTPNGFELTYLCAAYSFLPTSSMKPPYAVPQPIIFDGRAALRYEGRELKFSHLSAVPIYMSEYHIQAAEGLRIKREDS
jgi:hypothetical protein